jgi:ferredoxin
MRVSVDGARCRGHGRCREIAGELFDADDQGYARAASGGRVPPGLEARARRAAANCPESAIAVEEDG